MALFLQACGAAGPLRLGVEYPAGREALRRELGQPFLLVGREAEADLRLDDPAVSRRHAYLQVIAGHLFCLDLQSRTGVLWDGQPRCSGWLEPEGAVGIGPFAVRLLGLGGAAGAADGGDPLAALPPDQDPLPPVSLEVLSASPESASWRMDRVLALVGQTAPGTLRVGGRGVLRPSCGLLRTPLGLWVIDLLAPGGVSVNGVRVWWARLEDGDELRVGGLSLGVTCHTAPAPAPAPPPGTGATGPDALVPGVPPGEAERVERERLRAEQQAAAAEAEQLRGRLSALERALAEASAARDELVNAGQEAGARWEVERLALWEQWEREQRARAEETERFDADRRQWQEQRDVLQGQLDQERRERRDEAERLRQEAAALRRQCEALVRQVGVGSYDAAPAVPPAPAAPARRDELAGEDAFFIALGRSSAGSGGARRTGDGGRPPARP